jgi:DNA-binding transcriptional regulator YiaG
MDGVIHALRDEMTKTEFHDALKATGLTQRALAQELGVAVSTVNRWATGGLPIPKYASAYLGLLRNRQTVSSE